MVKPSLAEQYRAHREAFELALELGCTPLEAAQELRRRRAILAGREAARRLAQKMSAPLTMGFAAPPPAERNQPWMLRD